MKLNAPLLRQPKDSVECGLACLEMIYSYYGINKPLDKLREEFPTYEIGTYTPVAT